MFRVLRMIVIVVIALAIFSGTGVTAQEQSRGRWDSMVVLEAMPDTSFRERTKPRVNKYRTPFIIPISPPDFGAVTEPSRAPVDPVPVDRPTQRLVEQFAPVELPIETNSSNHMLVGTLEPIANYAPWASQIVTPTSTRSKVVSVVAPNVQRLSERITEHSLNVEATKDQLSTRETWTLDELSAILTQLEAQHASERLLSLYWKLLEPRDQWRVGRIRSLTENIELFRQRLFETTVALDVKPEAVTPLDRPDAQSYLQELGRRIDGMVNEREAE